MLQLGGTSALCDATNHTTELIIEKPKLREELHRYRYTVVTPPSFGLSDVSMWRGFRKTVRETLHMSVSQGVASGGHMTTPLTHNA